jgi:hypothetical protein
MRVLSLTRADGLLKRPRADSPCLLPASSPQIECAPVGIIRYHSTLYEQPAALIYRAEPVAGEARGGEFHRTKVAVSPATWRCLLRCSSPPFVPRGCQGVSGAMLIRVRTKVATWRVDHLEPTTSIAELRLRVQNEHHVRPGPNQTFSLDAQARRVVREADTLGDLGLRHGDLLFYNVGEKDCAAEVGKKIAADGTIINKTHEEASRERGFRPGLMSLRSMRMQWTLTDFVALDAQVGRMMRE